MSKRAFTAGVNRVRLWKWDHVKVGKILNVDVSRRNCMVLFQEEKGERKRT